MGQKVNPVGFRVGVYRGWDASWFARKGKGSGSYAVLVLEDIKIREYCNKIFKTAEISKIEIERAGENIRVIIHTSRPGIIIGKKGQEIEALRKDLAKLLNRANVEVSVQEIKSPELDATLVAKNIAAQLEKRANFKQVMKRAAAAAVRSGARGVKICCAGRLGGAEIARTEWYRAGSIPLHTLKADVDYACAEALTTYGIIGVKVWIYKGEFPKVS